MYAWACSIHFLELTVGISQFVKWPYGKPTVNECPENKSPNLIAPGHCYVCCNRYDLFSSGRIAHGLRLKSYWSWKSAVNRRLLPTIRVSTTSRDPRFTILTISIKIFGRPGATEPYKRGIRAGVGIPRGIQGIACSPQWVYLQDQHTT